MSIGVITGSGTATLEGLAQPVRRSVDTRFGAAQVASGRLGGVEVHHVGRHGQHHQRLSHELDPRATVAALAQLGVTAVVGTTACGAVETGLEPGTLIVFDDLHFPQNRLANGELCTLFNDPTDSARGHWVFDRPFAVGAREALLAGAAGAGHAAVRNGGTYAHTDGPRFESASEIRALAAGGVAAVSQTAGPEVVLFGEAGIPYGLAGFVTNPATGMGPGAATGGPTEAHHGLERMLTRGGAVLARVLAGAVRHLADTERVPAGRVIRIG